MVAMGKSFNAPRYAVVLTHNRLDLLRSCVYAIARQLDGGTVVVVDNASNPRVRLSDLLGPAAPTVAITYLPDQPPNLAKNMNAGLALVRNLALHGGASQWDVAMLCDDVMVPTGWFDSIAPHLRLGGVVAGSTHSVAPVAHTIVKHEPDGDIYNRMQGSAFVIAGEAGLWADESMHWWWQDTDLDWQARKAGGVVIAAGPVAENGRPNDFTYAVPGLAEQAVRDGEQFARKWGWRPW